MTTYRLFERTLWGVFIIIESGDIVLLNGRQNIYALCGKYSIKPKHNVYLYFGPDLTFYGSVATVDIFMTHSQAWTSLHDSISDASPTPGFIRGPNKLLLSYPGIINAASE
jgi:hypothetical protein